MVLPAAAASVSGAAGAGAGAGAATMCLLLLARRSVAVTKYFTEQKKLQRKQCRTVPTCFENETS